MPFTYGFDFVNIVNANDAVKSLVEIVQQIDHILRKGIRRGTNTKRTYGVQYEQMLVKVTI